MVCYVHYIRYITRGVRPDSHHKGVNSHPIFLILTVQLMRHVATCSNSPRRSSSWNDSQLNGFWFVSRQVHAPVDDGLNKCLHVSPFPPRLDEWRPWDASQALTQSDFTRRNRWRLEGLCMTTSVSCSAHASAIAGACSSS